MRVPNEDLLVLLECGHLSLKTYDRNINTLVHIPSLIGTLNSFNCPDEGIELLVLDVVIETGNFRERSDYKVSSVKVLDIFINLACKLLMRNQDIRIIRINP